MLPTNRRRRPRRRSTIAADSVGDDADITADVDTAFDEETDPDKASRPAPVGFEGDLEVTPLALEDVGKETLMACLRTMMTSRRLDEKMLTLLKQGKGYFHIGSSGHEASQTALGRALRRRPRRVLLLLPRPGDRALGRHDAARDPARPFWQGGATRTPAGARCRSTTATRS